ncbi:hypothetical protein ACRYCC_27135 [Actinomadura scrupuli]|uniref:hypothetical protein n=1 Tax=Actinomadura scrupuli TaxID=559629 RepID=UPI003D980F38
MTNRTTIAMPDGLDSALDHLNEIHKQMRWLELAHTLNPSDQDPADYQTLIDELTGIISEFTNVTDSDPGNPAALAATAFPLTISAAMNTPPGQAPRRIREAPPGSRNLRPEP